MKTCSFSCMLKPYNQKKQPDLWEPAQHPHKSRRTRTNTNQATGTTRRKVQWAPRDDAIRRSPACPAAAGWTPRQAPPAHIGTETPNSSAQPIEPDPGGTTLNQLPIGLHVKILNFNGRFEAYWATFGMLSWYQSIQNRWKFNICFNVWVVVGILFAVRARKQRPPCFWPDFKPQNAIPPPSHHTGLLSSSKQYFIFLRF